VMAGRVTQVLLIVLFEAAVAQQHIGLPPVSAAYDRNPLVAIQPGDLGAIRFRESRQHPLNGRVGQQRHVRRVIRILADAINIARHAQYRAFVSSIGSGFIGVVVGKQLDRADVNGLCAFERLLSGREAESGPDKPEGGDADKQNRDESWAHGISSLRSGDLFLESKGCALTRAGPCGPFPERRAVRATISNSFIARAYGTVELEALFARYLKPLHRWASNRLPGFTRSAADPRWHLPHPVLPSTL
jgi:hypothetical protein